MVKRKGGLSGLSRFVLDAFKQDTPSGQRVSDPVVECAEPAVDKPEDDRPVKRRKTENITDVPEEQSWQGKWIEKYDATGLVPHCTHASQVPEHLKKCAYHIWGELNDS